MRGKNHWNWKGGLSSEEKLIRQSIEYKEWRLEVYKRDHWTCQDCNIKQSYPIAHHLKSFHDYPELRFEIYNGVTLCRSCHLKRHRIVEFSNEEDSRIVIVHSDKSELINV